MAVSNSGIADVQVRIRELEKKIKLTVSDERKQMFQDEIDLLNKQIANANRKESMVVPIKNAATVGDAMERKLKSRSSQSKLRDGRFML